MERIRIFNEYDLKRLFQELNKKERTRLRIEELTMQEFNLGICRVFESFNGLDYFPDKRITDREILGENNVLYVIDGKIVSMYLENEYFPPSAFGFNSKEIASKRIIFSRQEESWRNEDILYEIFLDYSRKNIQKTIEEFLEIRKKSQREEGHRAIHRELMENLKRIERKVSGK